MQDHEWGQGEPPAHVVRGAHRGMIRAIGTGATRLTPSAWEYGRPARETVETVVAEPTKAEPVAIDAPLSPMLAAMIDATPEPAEEVAEEAPSLINAMLGEG